MTTQKLEQVQAERDDALRLADALRESLRVAQSALCEFRCSTVPPRVHTAACAKRARILAGDLT